MKYNFNFGTSDFKKLIENNNFFAGKSLFIKEMIKKIEKYFNKNYFNSVIYNILPR